MYMMLDYHYDLKQSLMLDQMMKKQIQMPIASCGCDEVYNEDGWQDLKGDTI